MKNNFRDMNLFYLCNNKDYINNKCYYIIINLRKFDLIQLNERFNDFATKLYLIKSIQ